MLLVASMSEESTLEAELNSLGAKQRTLRNELERAESSGDHTKAASLRSQISPLESRAGQIQSRLISIRSKPR